MVICTLNSARIYLCALKITLTVIIITSSVQAQTIIKLWPTIVPGEAEPKHEPKRLADAPGNIVRISNITDPEMLVFEPAVTSPKHPAVLVCPGGGYSLLAIGLEGTEIAEWFNKMGYTAFVLEYRTPNKREGALQDAQRAMSLIRKHAAKYNIDAAKVGVVGFSAGGSLGARLSATVERTYPAVDKSDSASFKPNFAMLIYPAYLDEGPDKSLSPDIKIDNTTPPMFILQTQDDPSANSALVMASALRIAKIPIELHLLFAGGRHGFGIREGIPAAQIWPALAIAWLNRVLPTLPEIKN